MAMFRALSTRNRSQHGGYDKLLDETGKDPQKFDHQDNAVLKRAISVPASMLFGSSTKKLNSDSGSSASYSKPKKQEQPKKKSGKSHPVFSLFEGKWNKKKKITANPDFSRYIEYLKEGGVWNKDTNSPAIYYK